jgi:hypothetical protein
MGGGRSEGAKVNVKVGPRARALKEDKGEFGVRGLLHLVPVKRPAASYRLPRPGRDIALRMSYPLVQNGRMNSMRKAQKTTRPEAISEWGRGMCGAQKNWGEKDKFAKKLRDFKVD